MGCCWILSHQTREPQTAAGASRLPEKNKRYRIRNGDKLALKAGILWGHPFHCSIAFLKATIKQQEEITDLMMIQLMGRGERVESLLEHEAIEKVMAPVTCVNEYC